LNVSDLGVDQPLDHLAHLHPLGDGVHLQGPLVLMGAPALAAPQGIQINVPMHGSMAIATG
jgi:hypothetical protein